MDVQKNELYSIKELTTNITSMFAYNSYMCLGLYYKETIVGITNCWKTVRNYSGKQLELDNVIIDNKLQSKGFGKKFFKMINNWAKNNGYKTVELHTYIENDRSHKFYFNNGFKILGFHFQKQL